MPENYSLIRTIGTGQDAPNVIAVVNIPLGSVPARGYIFDAYINQTFGSIEGAAKYFAERMAKIPPTNIFNLGFVFGNRSSESSFCKDIFLYPWEISADEQSKGSRIRAIPEIIKDGELQSWKVREKGDFWPILASELMHYNGSESLERYAEELPKIPGLEFMAK